MPRIIKHLGRVDYEPTWRAMQAFTDSRGAETRDELWVVEHPPVFTQGLAGKPEHLLQQNDVPVVKTDRGGQITYTAPASWWSTCWWTSNACMSACASWCAASSRPS